MWDIALAIFMLNFSIALVLNMGIFPHVDIYTPVKLSEWSGDARGSKYERVTGINPQEETEAEATAGGLDFLTLVVNGFSLFWNMLLVSTITFPGFIISLGFDHGALLLIPAIIGAGQLLVYSVGLIQLITGRKIER